MRDENLPKTDSLWRVLKNVLWGSLFFIITAFIILISSPYLTNWKFEQYSTDELSKRTQERSSTYQYRSKVVNGLDVETGMVYDDNFALVKATCTSCHSSKLIIQNRATREGWKEMIRWMQETQGLPDLGTVEPKVLDYLAAHYAPKNIGRRSNLDIEKIEWYVLKESHSD